MKTFFQIALFGCLSLQVSATDERAQEGKRVEQQFVVRKSFELSASANRWLEILNKPAIGFDDRTRCLRLLYGVTPEYESQPKFAIMAEASPEEVIFTVLGDGMIRTSTVAIDLKQWKVITGILESEEIWKKAKFYELMLMEAKSSSIWLVEDKVGTRVQICVNENLRGNPLQPDDGAVPSRQQTVLLYATVFGQAPPTIVPKESAEWFKTLLEQYRKPRPFESKEAQTDGASNKASIQTPDPP